VAIRNGQSRETGNIEYTRRRKTKQKHNTICVGLELSYKQLEVKTNRTSFLCRNRNGHHNTKLRT